MIEHAELRACVGGSEDAVEGVPETQLRRALALADWFALLGAALHYELLGEVAQGIVDGSFAQDVETVAAEAGCEDERVRRALSLLSAHGGDDLQALTTHMRCGYTALFNHPEHPAVPFFEGAFVDAKWEAQGKAAPDARTLFVNRAALDAERQYKRAGLARSADANVPADGMDTELEFMQRLCARLAQAIADDDTERILELQSWIGEFTRIHLCAWMADFFNAIVRQGVDDCLSAVALFGSVLAETSHF